MTPQQITRNNCYAFSRYNGKTTTFLFQLQKINDYAIQTFRKSYIISAEMDNSEFFQLPVEIKIYCIPRKPTDELKKDRLDNMTNAFRT